MKKHTKKAAPVSPLIAIMAAVAARGWAEAEEYDAIVADESRRSEVPVLNSTKGENLWVIRLDGEENKVLVASDLERYQNCARPVTGMVGWVENGQFDNEKSLEMWRALGEEPVRYFHSLYPITAEEQVEIERLSAEFKADGQDMPDEKILWAIRRAARQQPEMSGVTSIAEILQHVFHMPPEEAAQLEKEITAGLPGEDLPAEAPQEEERE